MAECEKCKQMIEAVSRLENAFKTSNGHMVIYGRFTADGSPACVEDKTNLALLFELLREELEKIYDQ